MTKETIMVTAVALEWVHFQSENMEEVHYKKMR